MRTIPSVLATMAVLAGCGGSKLQPGRPALGADASDGGDAPETPAREVHPDARSCALDANLFCVSGGASGSGLWCGDVVTAAICEDGTWRCPDGMIDDGTCTCGFPGVACANVTCTKTGWVCPDAGVDPPIIDGGACAFSATYTFFDDGGLRPYFDSVVLAPPRSETIVRHSGTPDAGTCEVELPCASTSGIGVAAIEDAIANPDVQAALAKPAGMLYGVDTRPVDGSVFVFQRGDGKGFMVGAGAAVPAGLASLAVTLHAVDAQAFAAPECNAL